MGAMWVWYLALVMCGAAVMPSAAVIFRKFEDRGWLFARTAGLFFGAWVMWTLNVLKWRYFTQGNILGVIVILFAVNYGVYAVRQFRRAKAGNSAADAAGALTGISIKTAAVEEALFLALFLLWVYIIGFKPEAYGTEKFMDYGFLTSMMRSLTMPFEDTWFSGKAINYYYGGQYITAYLIKLTGVTAGEGYNLMRASVAAFSFVLPFSLVRQMLEDRLNPSFKGVGRDNKTRQIKAESREVLNGKGRPESKESQEESENREGKEKAENQESRNKRKRHPAAPWTGGVLAGFAVAFCGNMHYVIYGIIIPIVDKLKGVEYSYWFPDSTRYIGYNPDLPDKTIHEFPAYSTVLGDLHAHYINILFVVTVTAAACAWAQKYAEKKWQSGVRAALRLALSPEVVLIGFLTGAFRWTNFWDFPIYYVVAGSIFFFVQLQKRPDKGESGRGSFFLQFIFNMILIAAVMFAAGYAAALPFTASFDQISSEIGMTHSHTLAYQIVILWGLPAACLIGYVLTLIREGREAHHHLAVPDLCILMFGLCAAGLVFLPEVIYVKDIYADTHYRANTMFKLTYQAFILFGMMMGYVLARAIALGREARAAERGRVRTENSSVRTDTHTGPADACHMRTGVRLMYISAWIGTALLLLTGGYIVQSCASWFGNIFIPENRVSTDASVFVSEYFASDFDAVNFLNTEVTGQPVVLEAPGDSYSDYERISVATGLPTVAGWHTHEWLWRGDTAELDQRIADVETIYTSGDTETVRELTRKYNISYIYVGNLEREKYPALNDAVLRSLGDAVYDDGAGTYIVRIG